MVRKIVSFAAVTFLVLGCSRSGSKVQRNQQQYQTVQEGSASGVTSTINAPGETTPPLTNTNVDTTTNFTLPTNPAPLGTDTTGGSMASAMPAAPSYPGGAPGMPASRPRTSTRPASVANAPVVTDTIGSTTPPMPRERPQSTPPAPRTDTTAPTTTDAPPPPTDTMMTDGSSTTSTSPTTDTKKKKDDGKKNDSDQPPPPPPPTDTRG